MQNARCKIAKKKVRDAKFCRNKKVRDAKLRKKSARCKIALDSRNLVLRINSLSKKLLAAAGFEPTPTMNVDNF